MPDDDTLHPDGVRRLAAAVLQRAIEHEGERYLDSPDFDLWCRAANCRPDILRHQIRQTLRRHPPRD